MKWYEMEWNEKYGKIWYDMVGNKMIWYNETIWNDVKRYGMIWNDGVWHEITWYDMI